MFNFEWGKKMNVLVTGSRGQLGSELHELVNNSALNTQHSTFHFTDRNTVDITDQDAIKRFCLEKDIEVIINCAAYTAVDKAEEDEINADKINHLAVKYLAQIAKEKNIKLIHISTDYVFDGKNYKPYNEDDTPNPQGVYGKTKLLGEEAIKIINPNSAIIIRTSWVYSTFGNNFVKTMLRLGKEKESLGVIFDQIGTPTYAKDLAVALLRMMNDKCLMLNENVEIYNFSNEGVVSWYDFAKAIFELSGIECQVNPIETYQYPTPATRPHYSLLNKSKIKNKYNIIIPYWKDSLKTSLQNMKG
jgi:dTDP-4-dehydrorhamnose reductase